MTHPGTAAPGQPTEKTSRRVARAAIGVAAIEYYDYFAFGLAATLVFSKEFFPGSNATAALLASFATFAVGFIARPIGAALAGHLGDRYGRTTALVGALIVMGVSTLAMAALPTYAQIGLWAAAILAVMRVLQGLAMGAQWGGAVVLASEYAPPHRRGLYAGLVQLAIPLGLLTANAVFLLLDVTMSQEQATRYGWRLAFCVSGFALFLAWYLHRNVEETPSFKAAQLSQADGPKQPAPVVRILKNPRTVLLATGTNISGSTVFYVTFIGALDYCTRVLGIPNSSVLPMVLIAAACQFVFLPLSSALSDRIGRPRLYGIGIALETIWAFPMFLLIDTGSLVLIGVALSVMSSLFAVMSGPQAGLFAELFDATERYTGASLGYQLANVVGGGPRRCRS
jgi:MFS family permease